MYYNRLRIFRFYIKCARDTPIAKQVAYMSNVPHTVIWYIIINLFVSFEYIQYRMNHLNANFFKFYLFIFFRFLKSILNRKRSHFIARVLTAFPNGCPNSIIYLFTMKKIIIKCKLVPSLHSIAFWYHPSITANRHNVLKILSIGNVW